MGAQRKKMAFLRVRNALLLDFYTSCLLRCCACATLWRWRSLALQWSIKLNNGPANPAAMAAAAMAEAAVAAAAVAAAAVAAAAVATASIAERR